MSQNNRHTGAITITPPLTWAEVRLRPAVEDVRLRIVEDVEDTPTGQVKTVTADAIIPRQYSYAGYSVAQDIQAIVSWETNADRKFVGYIECQLEAGLVEPGQMDRKRYVVVDGRVETVTPRLVWPGDEPQPAPVHMSADEVAAVLSDMAARVKAGDSYDGSISYYTDYEADPPRDGFDVTAAYRIGNSTGQGGMRIIRGEES